MFSQFHPFTPFDCKDSTLTQNLTQRLYSIPTNNDTLSLIALKILASKKKALEIQVEKEAQWENETIS